MGLILLSITWKMLSASNMGVFFMDQFLILQDPIWPIKLDFRKDQRILLKKYLTTFNPFSSFSTAKLFAILAIFRFSCFSSKPTVQYWQWNFKSPHMSYYHNSNSTMVHYWQWNFKPTRISCYQNSNSTIVQYWQWNFKSTRMSY